MKFKFIAILITIGYSFAQDPPEPTGPWTTLLGPEKPNLDGFHHRGDPPWSLNTSTGILEVSGYTTSKTMLIWKDPLKNFEVSTKYRLSSTNANSGIQVHSYCRNDETDPDDICNNFQICGLQLDVAMAHSGKLFDECNAFYHPDPSGTPGDLDNMDRCRETLNVNEWMIHTGRINGDTLSIWLNGVFCLRKMLSKPDHTENSIFAIQSHPPYHLIEWEHIKIRNLDLIGCTNPNASNYDSNAVEDDSSCIVSVHPQTETLYKPSLHLNTSNSIVTYSIPLNGTYTITLTDFKGQILFRESGLGPIKNKSLKLKVSGVQFIAITSGSNTAVQKFVNK